jgi:hypothetical protein
MKIKKKNTEKGCNTCLYRLENMPGICPYCNPPDWKFYRKAERKVLTPTGEMWRRVNRRVKKGAGSLGGLLGKIF